MRFSIKLVLILVLWLLIATVLQAHSMAETGSSMYGYLLHHLGSLHHPAGLALLVVGLALIIAGIKSGTQKGMLEFGGMLVVFSGVGLLVFG